MTEQLSALQIADELDKSVLRLHAEAAAELRRLHEENFALAAQQCLYHDGSGLTGDESGTAVCMKDLELRRLHAEVQEQCRINGMGAERELRLMAEKRELLEALKEIEWSNNEQWRTDRARAAIAKAEGETK